MGVRTVVFDLGCWNEDTWDVDKTLETPNQAVIFNTLMALDDPFPKDLALLGGDPLMPNGNLEDVVEIVGAIKRHRPNTRVLCWTGFKMEALMKGGRFKPALELIDILIDGRYEKDLHVDGKKYGSTNQRIIDVKKSLEADKIVLAPEQYKG